MPRPSAPPPPPRAGGVLAPGAHVVVFAGGDAPLAASLAGLGPVDHVIAADSGLDHARALGASVDVLVGDLDSVSAEGRRWATARGVEVVEHPTAKDETDLQLALRAARARGARRITVVGGHGGRLDHLLANVALLAAPEMAGVDVQGLLGPARVTVIRARTVLAGRPGELVSLLPCHGRVAGITTTGLRFPLCDEALVAGSPRGVSNVFELPEAVVSVGSGTLVAVQPEAFT